MVEVAPFGPEFVVTLRDLMAKVRGNCAVEIDRFLHSVATDASPLEPMVQIPETVGAQ
jgi:hypothetical protein